MARWQEEITLVGRAKNGTNDLGDPIFTDTETSVFADRLEVSQSEFYQAKAQGLKPKVRFKIRVDEYSGEEKFTHDGEAYDVLRTYKVDYDFMEIVGQSIVNKG